jgi:hypothetical protein
VWSFGASSSQRRVSRREFLRGYTHIINNASARHNLAATLEDLLGGCWDTFESSYRDGKGLTGVMTKQQFADYVTCWNLSEDEAMKLFEEIAGEGAEGITREQYLLAAWDFYFSMDPSERRRGGHNFFGRLSDKKSSLAF